MKLPVPILFDWDEGNRDKSWQKHKIHFKETEEVFFNKPVKIFPDKKHSTAENRFLGLGRTNNDNLLTIIFTIRNKKLRIISALSQNKKERKIYEK